MYKLSCRVVVAFCAAIYVTTASAQIFAPLHTFSTTSTFDAPVTIGPDGTLYSVALGGGAGNNGAVFTVQPDGSGFAILYSFTNGIDGGAPIGGLALSNNVLYGTCSTGGAGGNGTVFKINTDGSGFSPIYAFTAYTNLTNFDGAVPKGNLILADNVLYGTTSDGGKKTSGPGTVFKLNTDGSGFTVVYSFSGIFDSVDGSQPIGGLILSGSTLFGTTQYGGTNNAGTVFKVDTTGNNFATIHTFPATFTGTNTDGANPQASLIISGNTLFGTAESGGFGYGTVFSLNTDGSNFTNLYSFTNSVDGGSPYCTLLLTNGALFGTTKQGGNSPGYGTVFKLNSNGTGFTNLFRFDFRAGIVTGTAPLAGVAPYNGALFGTTASGNIFKINPDGSGFAMLAGGNEGAIPVSGLVPSGNSLYGTASSGGNGNSGIIFRVSNDGARFANLYTFTPAKNDPIGGGITNLDGSGPSGTMALGGDSLYGTTQNGGVYGYGVVFRVNTNGTGFTNLHSFAHTSSDGANPAAGVILAGSSLYGTTKANGTSTYGAVFRMNTNGTGFTNLYAFSQPLGPGTNSDGSTPRAGLVLGGDTLYGVAAFGGNAAAGTIFKITTNGTGFTVMHHFSDGSVTNDGATPDATLILSGSTLYGSTFSGGTPDSKQGFAGTLFKINTDGSGYDVFYRFDWTESVGVRPLGALAFLNNVLCGTTSAGGQGTVFQINPSGSAFSLLHVFPVLNGDVEGDTLVSGGIIYGTSKLSSIGSGNIFSVTPTPTPMVQFTANPTSGIPPTIVQFTCPNTDDKGNTLTRFNWDFGDGTTNVTQSPSHTYTNEGPFTVTLIATNINGATIISPSQVINVIYPTNILNGGFEAGTFTNWTLTGGTHNVTTSSTYVHSGTHGAQIFSSGTLAYLSQTLTTTPGALYNISCWLKCTGGTPNDFQILWNGTVLLNATNIPNVGWTNYQTSVTANTNISVVQFSYRNDLAYFGFDDVTLTATAVTPVQPDIAGVNISGNNLVFNNTNSAAGHTYFLLMATNITEPLNQWLPIATNSPSGQTFTITATNAIDPTSPQRYFILETQ